MNDCLIIRGVNRDTGKTFRPATRSPDKHWAYMLMDQYSHILNMSIKWIDGEPMVTLTRSAHTECESAFVHVMEFCKRFNLDATWCRRECEKCSGHISCVSPVTRLEVVK